MNLEQIGYTGGAGILGALLTFFGLKSRVDRMADTVRYVDTCEAIHTGIEKKLDDHEAMLKEIRSDVKTVLRNGHKK